MAQGTPDLEQYFPAGLRLLEHRPAGGGESEREQARALLSGPQARISRLRDFAALDEPSRPGPARAAGRTRNRGGDRSEADAGALIAGAPADLTGVTEVGPVGPSRNGDELAESDLDNLTAVLGHEVAPNTMKNYRVQWNNFINWAAAKGVRALPADPRHVAAYLAERIEEHGHKPATLRAAAAAIAFIHRSAGQDDPCASPEVNEDAQERNAQGRQGPEAGSGAHGRGARRHPVDRLQPSSRPGRQAGGPGDRQVQGEPGHSADQPDARCHAQGLRGRRPDLERHSVRGRRHGTPADPALQDGRRGRGGRRFPVRPDDGGAPG